MQLHSVSSPTSPSGARVAESPTSHGWSFWRGKTLPPQKKTISLVYKLRCEPRGPHEDQRRSCHMENSKGLDVPCQEPGTKTNQIL